MFLLNEPEANKPAKPAKPEVVPASKSNLASEFPVFYEETCKDFYTFLEMVFSKAIINKYGKWASGPYVKRCADFLQSHRRTMYVGPRGHFKSVRFYAYIMWLIWKNFMEDRNIRIYYFSYNDKLAAAHINNLKELVNKSGWLTMGLTDLDSTAKSQALYTWWNKDRPREQQTIIEIKSFGIMGGSRGLHCEYLFLDDPYQDPDSDVRASVEPLAVAKINEAFETRLIPIPIPEGEFHIIGTPQSESDIWSQGKFDMDSREAKGSSFLKFKIRKEKAYSESMVDGKLVTEALFPELLPLEYIKSQESILAPAVFRQEYMCEPRSAADSFFDPERIEKSTNYGLINYDYMDTNVPRYNKEKFKRDVFAAYDPAKSRHPGHLIVAYREGNKLVQLLSKWFDGWDYSYEGWDKDNAHKKSQFKYIKEAVEYFGVKAVYSDNTNGVLTQLIEMGTIPQMVEIKISSKSNNTYATVLQELIGTPNIEFVADARQKDALLALQSTLKIMETSSGPKRNHGEAFSTWGMLTSNTVAKGRSGLVKRIDMITNKYNIKKMFRGVF